MNKFKYAFLAALFTVIAACGGAGIEFDDSGTTTTTDTTAPTISSAGAGSEALTVGVTKALSSIPSSFTFTFSEEIDPDTATTGNVSLTCEEDEAFTVSLSSDKKTLTVTLTDLLSQADSCTITLGTGFTDNASASLSQTEKGNSLASAQAYPFTTPCSTDSSTASNDLRDELRGSSVLTDCWSALPGNTSFQASTIDSDEGTLTVEFDEATTLASGTPGGYTRIMDATNASIILKVTDFTGWNGPTSGGRTSFGLVLSKTDFSAVALCALLGADDGTGTDELKVEISDAGSQAQVLLANGTSFADITSTTAVYLKLTKTGTNFTCGYKFEGDDDFTTIGTTLTFNPGGEYKAGITFGHSGATTTDSSTTVDKVIFSEES